MTTTETTLPLNKLIPSKANVRRTGKAEGIAALAASIAATGLRQNLNVRPTHDGGRYEVVAGGRRLAALKRLAKEGKLAKDAPIACLVLDDADDASEISLTENAMRLDMHPDDQCEAFRTLIEDKGMGVEDVAARFGVTPAVVTRRLKLASVSPTLRALYRKGTCTLEHMMAFALSDDHAAQEEAWKVLPEWNRDARDIRAFLTQEAVAMSDRFAVFVGEDAYVEAGGNVLRDLFDERGSGYLTDRALLLRLASEKLAAAAETVQAEGWAWVKPELQPDYDTRYGHLQPLDSGDEDDERYAPEDIARAGARLRVGYHGDLDIERGLLQAEALEGDAAPALKAKAEPGALSGRMVEELTAHRTAALRIELTRSPSTALAATVHALALPLLYPVSQPITCLSLRSSSETLERHTDAMDDSPAHAAMQATVESWQAQLPADPNELFAWCLAQPQEVLLELLALVAGLSVNAIAMKHDHVGHPRLGHADALAAALSLDMAAWWSPSVDGFYRRLPKATLVHAVTEAKASLSVNLGSLKKDEAARYVAKALNGTGWLPSPLRGASAAVHASA